MILIENGENKQMTPIHKTWFDTHFIILLYGYYKL